MTTPYPHVSRVLEHVRHGMHAWAASLMKEAGLDVAVSGSVPAKGRTTRTRTIETAKALMTVPIAVADRPSERP